MLETLQPVQQLLELEDAPALPHVIYHLLTIPGHVAGADLPVVGVGVQEDLPGSLPDRGAERHAASLESLQHCSVQGAVLEHGPVHGRLPALPSEGLGCQGCLQTGEDGGQASAGAPALVQEREQHPAVAAQHHVEGGTAPACQQLEGGGSEGVVMGAVEQPALQPPLPRAGLMWGVNAHEWDHIPASYVTLTILSMFVFDIFNGRLLRTSVWKV